MKSSKEIPEVKIGELFDLEGEPAAFKLFEKINLNDGSKYYILKLDLIGRQQKLRFSEEEVKEKNLKYVKREKR